MVWVMSLMSWVDLLKTHLFDECVIVDFDVDVDRSVRKCLENLSEERDACVFGTLTETLYAEKHRVESVECYHANDSMSHWPNKDKALTAESRSICVPVPL